MKYGVFLARMQPLHIAHTYLIKKALSDCENVVIVLGSSNKKNIIRNPFDFNFRRELLELALIGDGLSEELKRISIFELPDWSYENDQNDTTRWGHYLYYNIVSRIQHKHFSIYYSDDSNIIKTWLDDEISQFVNLRLFNRSDVYDGLSATNIRRAIIENDLVYLNKFLHKSTIGRINEIRNYYTETLNNPSNDFSM